MGFCLVNFAAAAAKGINDKDVRDHFGASTLGSGSVKVGILDIDVHFGNGIEDILAGEDGYAYCSIHQAGIYPGNSGSDARAENIRKVGLPQGTEGEEWGREVMNGLEWLKGQGMDVLIVACGYDGLEGDPLGGFALTPGDFKTVARDITRGFKGGEFTAWGVEGGYKTGEGGIGEAVRETIEGIMEGVEEGREGKGEEEGITC